MITQTIDCKLSPHYTLTRCSAAFRKPNIFKQIIAKWHLQQPKYKKKLHLRLKLIALQSKKAQNINTVLRISLNHS